SYIPAGRRYPRPNQLPLLLFHRRLSIPLGIDHQRQNNQSDDPKKNPTGFFLGCFKKESEHD
ncbi:hypothetical protein N9245_01275, partial [bacterium]|nr:hypothetical protein [bacterium]